MESQPTCFRLMKPIICGIVNATPDSFYDGGKHTPVTDHAKRLLMRGRLDRCRGESTRPGADLVSVQEEMDRVLPVIEGILKILLQ